MKAGPNFLCALSQSRSETATAGNSHPAAGYHKVTTYYTADFVIVSATQEEVYPGPQPLHALLQSTSNAGDVSQSEVILAWGLQPWAIPHSQKEARVSCLVR